MMIAPLAEPASMNVLWKLLLKVISTKLIPKFAPIVAHAPMFVRLKQFTLNNQEMMYVKPSDGVAFFLPEFFQFQLLPVKYCIGEMGDPVAQHQLASP
jgi:hypothetical protein